MFYCLCLPKYYVAQKLNIFSYTPVVPLEVKMIYKNYPWTFGEVGCDISTTICELVTHVPIVTMIAFSLER